MIGKKLGRLTIIKRAEDKKSSWGGYVWECKCDCGKTCFTNTGNLNRKKSPKRSCGCGQKDTQIKSEDVLGEKNPRWNGGKMIDHYGYRWIMAKNHPDSAKNGYIREHRLVMENKVGRRLKPEESVHHINFNKLDNNPDNLMLFKNESEHQKHHQELLRR